METLVAADPALFGVLVKDGTADPDDGTNVVHALVGVLEEIEGCSQLILTDLGAATTAPVLLALDPLALSPALCQDLALVLSKAGGNPEEETARSCPGIALAFLEGNESNAFVVKGVAKAEKIGEVAGKTAEGLDVEFVTLRENGEKLLQFGAIGVLAALLLAVDVLSGDIQLIGHLELACEVLALRRDAGIEELGHLEPPKGRCGVFQLHSIVDKQNRQ